MTTLITFVDLLAYILYVAMIGRVVMSWLNVGPTSPFFPVAKILYQLTEPVLAPIRRILPSFGMMDFSPMVAIFLIVIVQRILVAVAG